MRASEAPQQGRPRGAERLHMAFQGMFADPDTGAWAPRADKFEVPTRCSIATASTRASAQSSKTPHALRRSVQASSTHDRAAAPADPFASPVRGRGRKLAYGPKSPAAPHSAGYAARHTGARPVYTAVGISTPAAPGAAAALSKFATSGLRASTASLSPVRPRRRPQQQQPAANAAQSKASPAKGAAGPGPAVGTTTSAVIAALAMDAALPELDPTALALLETILGGGSGAASPMRDPLGPPAGAAARTPAAAVRSPLGPAAKASSSTPQQQLAGGAGAGAAAADAKPVVLTQQLLQQHQQQYAQMLRQQALLSPPQQQQCNNSAAPSAANAGPALHAGKEALQPGLARLQTTGSGAEGVADGTSFVPSDAASGGILDSRAPRGAHAHPQLQPVNSMLCQQGSTPPPSQTLMSQSSFVCAECGSSTVVGCSAVAAGAAASPKPRAPPPSPVPAPQDQQQQLASAPSAQPLESPGTLSECNSLGGSGVQGVAAASAAMIPRPRTVPGGSHPGLEDAMTARTSRALEHAAESPPARRPPGTHSATNIQHSAGATGAMTSPGGALASPASPGSRTIIKRLCRSHAAGSLSTKMLRSPKDDPRRPTTYAELQCISKLHQQTDQPSSPRQQHLQQPDSTVGGTSSALDTSSPAASDAKQTDGAKGAAATATAAVVITSLVAERPARSRSDLDGPSAAAYVSSYGPLGGNRLTGPNLMLPETIVERGSTSAVSEAKTPTLWSQQKRQQQQPQAAADAAAQVQAAPPKAAKRGLLGGLLACLGLGGSTKEARPATSVTRPAAAPAAAQNNVRSEGAPAAVPPTPAGAAAPPHLQVPAKDVGTTTTAAITAPAATSTVAAVAAALSMSPNTAAAHINSDSRLLLLLRAELAASGVDEAEAGKAGSGRQGSGQMAKSGKGIAAEDSTARTAEQQAPGDAASPRTPRASGTLGGSGSARPPATPLPGAAAAAPAGQPWQSRSPLAPAGSGRQAPDGDVATCSPLGHLSHEDGDSVLRGSVDVQTAAATAVASCLSFSPSVPAPSRPQHLPRAGSSAVTQAGGGGTPLRSAARQALGLALEAEAAAAAPSSGTSSDRGAGSGSAFLEPPESDCREREREPEPLSPPRHQPGGGSGKGPGGIPGPGPLQPQAGTGSEVTYSASLDTHGGVAAGAAPPVPGLLFTGLPPVATTPAPRSNRKRSRATHGCGGGGLSQLDARKLAALPLEEMLEQIQAAIAAEDLATGRTVHVSSGGGGLSDDCSILPMPPVMVKAGRPNSLRRRKSGAGASRGGGGTTAGHHSGGGGGGGPSRGGRSSDGGTRGGAAVGAVQTTLMKAAAATASMLGGGRRRRRVRNRSSPVSAARRRQTPAQDPVYGSSSFSHPYGFPAPPVSPNSRKSDGASSYGQPVWRHGGRALAYNGMGFAGIPSNNTSPRAIHDNYFARQPPYKKAQLCTPTGMSTAGHAIAAAAGGGSVANAYYSGGGVMGGGSPPRLRQSAPAPPLHAMAPPPVTTMAKTPMPTRTPSTVHTNVRAARRLLDADDGPVRPMSYTAALMAASSPGKSSAATAGTAATAKKMAAAAAMPPGPVTSSHINISDLLSRYKLSAHAVFLQKKAPAAASPSTDGTAGPAAGGTDGGNASCQMQRPPPPLEKDSDGGALHSSARSPVETAACQAPVDDPMNCSHVTAGDGGGCASGESTPQRPRMVSVSLSELLLRASVADKQHQPSRPPSAGGSGRGSGGRCSSVGSYGVEPGIEGDVLPVLQEFPEESLEAAPVHAVTGEKREPTPTDASANGGAISTLTAATGDAVNAAAQTPGQKHDLREADGKLLHASAGEPNRTSVSYLELLQVYGQANGSRTAAVPHYALPIASRATSAGGGSGSGSAGGASKSVAEGDAPAGGESPVRRQSATFGGSASGAARTSQGSIGSYAQIAAMRLSPAAAAAGRPATVAAGNPAAPLAELRDTSVGEEAGETRDYVLPDAASATGSPVGGVAAAAVAVRGPSPTTSSVVAHLPSARSAAAEEAEVLASTAAVRSGGIRMLEDTADSGGVSDSTQPGHRATQVEEERKEEEEEGDKGKTSGCLRLRLVPGDQADYAVVGDCGGSGSVRAEVALVHPKSSGEGAAEASSDANVVAKTESTDVAIEAPHPLPPPRVQAASATSALTAAWPSLTSACCVDLPATPKRPPGTPLADWRCVPLAAYEASVKDYEVYFSAATDSD